MAAPQPGRATTSTAGCSPTTPWYRRSSNLDSGATGRASSRTNTLKPTKNGGPTQCCWYGCGDCSLVIPVTTISPVRKARPGGPCSRFQVRPARGTLADTIEIPVAGSSTWGRHPPFFAANRERSWTQATRGPGIYLPVFRITHRGSNGRVREVAGMSRLTGLAAPALRGPRINPCHRAEKAGHRIQMVRARAYCRISARSCRARSKGQDDERRTSSSATGRPTRSAPQLPWRRRRSR